MDTDNSKNPAPSVPSFGSFGSSLFSGLLGAGVSTLGNLIGNGISFKQQQKLAAQQFEYNKQLMQMQMDYNSPQNQMSMYRSAGINPNAVLGNNTSITGSSVGQGSAPSLGALGSDMLAAFNIAYQADADKSAKIASARAALSQSKTLDADALKKLSETKGIKLSNDILESQANDFKEKINLENNLVRSQIAELDTKSVYNELLSLKQLSENKRYNQIVDQELAESASRIKLMVQDGRLKRAQAVDALAGSILKKAQTIGVNIENRTANAVALDYIEKFAAEAQSASEDAKHKSKDVDWYEYNHTIGSILQGLDLGVKTVK